jgi:hypothetical protein
MASLAICVISNRDHVPDFTRCLAHMSAHLAIKPIFDRVDLKVAKNCSLLSVARQEMLDECMSEKFSHMLMLDDDMVFPPDLAHQLYGKGKRCIGVNSLRKNPDELHYTARGLDGEWVASKGRRGLQQVETVGMALFLLDLDAMRNIPKPHFEVRWNDEKQVYTGEDMYFCRKLTGAGEKIFIDHDLSNQCGHVGSLVYTFDFYDRFKSDAENVRAA